MAKISFYYQELENVVSTEDDLGALLDLHIKSFERHGWEVVKVDESDARKHPQYELFNSPFSILSKSMNAWEYTRACYMRWLAYAVAGHPFADFDVVNYGFTPADAEAVKAANVSGQPIFLSQAGAMGLFDAANYKQVIRTYTDFMDAPVIAGPLLDDINDMTIMRHLRMDWYNCLPYEDERFVKDFTRPGWDTAKLVHYPYSVTAQPRAATVMAERAPEL